MTQELKRPDTCMLKAPLSSMNGDKKQELGTVTGRLEATWSQEPEETKVCADSQPCPVPGEALMVCETPDSS